MYITSTPTSTGLITNFPQTKHTFFLDKSIETLIEISSNIFSNKTLKKSLNNVKKKKVQNELMMRRTKDILYNKMYWKNNYIKLQKVYQAVVIKVDLSTFHTAIASKFTWLLNLISTFSKEKKKTIKHYVHENMYLCVYESK